MDVRKVIPFIALAVMGSGAVVPTVARADDSTQGQKNTWRNGAIGAGAVAIYGLHNHDALTTVLGAAGAAYSAKKYEDERKAQSQQQRDQRSRYHRVYTNRKYYSYQGHQYYLDPSTGERVLVQ